ncbi:uncharacterized protein V1516DRAFT_89241 [Lipomyces oligophaga]|uniref:uncharacterized protein n=1 Tax=Lipomyces oligophaga TaxID=45792 RepID=UPI0034CFD465
MATDSSSEFASISLHANQGFSWIFLVELIVSGIIALFVLFYFNRVFASCVSLSIRWYTWHKYHVFLDVRSIQISFLGGRLFFKDIHYVGTNEAIFAVQGHITWRYWLSRVRKSSLLRNIAQSDEKDKESSLPARLQLSIDGLEWFVYNRTPAYDAELEKLSRAANMTTSKNSPDPCSYQASDTSTESIPNSTQSINIFSTEKKPHIGSSSVPSTFLSKGDGSLKHNVGSEFESFPISNQDLNKDDHISRVNVLCSETSSKSNLFLDLFPIDIHCRTGAVIVGNASTPTLVIGHFTNASGSVDPKKSRSSLDKYKWSYDFDFESPSIRVKDNFDFVQAEESNDLTAPKADNDEWLGKHSYSKWQSFLEFISFAFHKHGKAPASTPRTAWHGLDRYFDDSQDMQDAVYHRLENYAKCTSVFDAEKLKVDFYYDVAGVVPPTPDPLPQGLGCEIDIGNGGLPPQMGVDILLSGALIQYGPWADRQRQLLFDMFMPSAKVYSEPHRRLKSGEMREHTQMKLYVELDDNTIIRLPTREPSKDSEFYKFRRQYENVNGIRSFGWIELKLSEFSTVAYTSAYVACPEGVRNFFNADLNGLELRSSVNHEIFWKSQKINIIADLSNPLQWNGHANWIFDCEAAKSSTFLLREHITIISDLISDFTSGPGVLYEQFVPRTYQFNFTLLDLVLHLNVNDSNIISNPTDFDDNVFLTLSSPKLLASVEVPLTQIAPLDTTVKFLLETESVGLRLDAPSWHTYASFLGSKELGIIDQLRVDGSMIYVKSDVTSQIDTISLDISTESTVLILYGFVIRYLMNVKNNYFGEDVHFKTLEEFTREANYRRNYIGEDIDAGTVLRSDYSSNLDSENEDQESLSPDDQNDSNKGSYEGSTETQSDVTVTFSTNKGSIILPQKIYSASSHLRLDLDMFDVDLRFTKYYMDLQINISPIRGFAFDVLPAVVLDSAKSDIRSDPVIFIDGISIYGHRMFGLLPPELTYVCNWDFDLGIVYIEGSPLLYERLGDSLSAFSHTFADGENALLKNEPLLYDVTLLRVNIPSVRSLMHTEKSTLEFLLQEISIQLNDISQDTYNSKILFSISDVAFLCRERQQHGNEDTKILAYFNTSLRISNYEQKEQARDRRQKQQDHIRTEDYMFGRFAFALDPLMESSVSDEKVNSFQQELPILLPLPPMPIPLVELNSQSKYWGTGSESSNQSVVYRGAAASKYGQRCKQAYMNSYCFSCISATEEEKINFRSNFMPPYSCVTAFKDIEAVKAGYKRKFYKFESMYDAEGDDDGTKHILENDRPSVDNYIIDFVGGISGFLCVEAAETIIDIIDGLSRPDIISMLDSLQIRIFSRLKSNLKSVNSILSLRVNIPGLFVQYGAIQNRFTQSILSPPSVQMEECVDIEMVGISFVMNVVERSLVSEGEVVRRNPIFRKSTLRLDLSHFNISLVGEITDMASAPLQIDIDQVGFWCSTGEGEDATSIILRSFNLTVDSSKLSWTVNVLFRMVTPLIPLSARLAVISEVKSNRMKKLIYLIALASSRYEIAHDPAFLTRPAYVLRSSRAHIRANDSWKLLSRLRHIVRSLPSTILEDLYRDLSNENFFAPLDAKEQTVKVLSDWRSWEMVDISTCFIFGNVFDNESKYLELQPSLTHSSFVIERVCIELERERSSNIIRLDSISLTLDSVLQANSLHLERNSDFSPVIPEQSTENFDVTIGFDSITTELELQEILTLYNDIRPIVEVQLPELQETVIATRGRTPKAENLHGKSVAKLFISIAVHSSIKLSIQSTNLGINIETAAIESSIVANSKVFRNQVENIQNNLPPSSVCMKANSIRFDIVDPSDLPQKTLFTFYVDSPSVWTCVPSVAHREVRSLVQIRKIHLHIREDFIGLSDSVNRVLEKEIYQVLELISKYRAADLPEESPSVIEQSSNKSIFGGLSSKISGVTLDLQSYTIGINVLPSLVFMIKGSFVKLLYTELTDHVQSVSFEADEQIYEIWQRKKSRQVRITQSRLPRFTIITRIEDSQKISMRLNFKSIVFDVSSFPTLSSVLSGDVTKMELVQAQQSWRWTTAQIRKRIQVKSSKAVSSIKDPLDLSWKLSLYFKSVTLAAADESAESRVEMELSEIKVVCRADTVIAQTDAKVSGLFVNANIPNIGIFIHNQKFKTTKFQILQSCLALSVKSAENISNPDGIAVHEVALTSDRLHLTLSPYSFTLMVELLSQYEQKISTIDLPDFNISHNPNATVESESPGNLFRGPIRIRFLDCRINWLSDEFPDTARPFHLAVRLEQITLNCNGDGWVAMQIKNFGVQAQDSLKIDDLGTKSAIPKFSSAILNEISLEAAFNLNKDSSLRLNMQSSSLQVNVVTSVITACQAVVASLLVSAKSATEKIQDYKHRAAAHHQTVSPGSNLEEGSAPLSPILFRRVTIKSDFAGAKINFYGATRAKYIELNADGESRRPSTGADTYSGRAASNSKVSPLSGLVGTLRVPGVHVVGNYAVLPTRKTLRSEIFIEPSKNEVEPRVMPAVMEMIENFKSNVRERKDIILPETAPSRIPPIATTANELVGDVDLSVALRIGRQEFSLSCEPIAKVAALAWFDSFYVTLNTCEKLSEKKFLTFTAQVINLEGHLRHIYSRESSANMSIGDITLTVMSDQRIHKGTGITGVGKIDSVRGYLNLKQSHDLLLFQDIWSPNNNLDLSSGKSKSANERAELLVQRYHRVSSTSAVPWSIHVAVYNIHGQLDMGQLLGKLDLHLDEIWLSSRKTSDWEQHLAFGIIKLIAESKGRLGGRVKITNVRANSAIRWDTREDGQFGIPLVQIAMALAQLEARLFFDYRLFLICAATDLEFTMFNQQKHGKNENDKLVCVFDFKSINVYLTVLAPSNIMAIVNIVERINTERVLSYQAVLRDSQRFKIISPIKSAAPDEVGTLDEDLDIGLLRLGTEVNVRVKTVSVNVFPSTLADSEILKVEAANMSVKFGIKVVAEKIESHLELMLGQFLVALSTAKKVNEDVDDINIDEFMLHSKEAKGGTILRIPEVNVMMITMQRKDEMKQVEFIYKSSFDGRVDIGWNLGSINFIRDMWNTHARAFRTHQSSPTDTTDLHVLESEELEKKIKDVQLNKKYTYIPLEPPIIATPQLKDMGEATPPIEWLGLNRDRLPGLTHQAIVVTLQSLARKGETAYSNVLGQA